MSIVLFTSVVLRLMALFWALGLLYRLRDTRLGFFAALLGLMALSQTLMLYKSGGFDASMVAADWHELPSLMVSVLALLAVFFLEGYIKESRDIAAELQQRETQSREAQKLAKLGHWIWDEESNSCSWCSQEIPKIYETTADQLIGPERRYFRFVHPDDRQRILDLDSELSERPRKHEVEFRIVCPSGKVKTLFEVSNPNFDDNGKVTRWYGTTQDITELKQAEAALRQREIESLEAQRLAKLGHWLWEEKTNSCVWCSEEITRIYGVPMDQLIGLDHRFFELVHPDDKPRMLDLDRELSIHPRLHEAEFRIICPDGEVKSLLEVGEPIIDENGKVTHFRGTTQDVTAIKQAEAALRQNEARLWDFALAASDWFWETDVDYRYTFCTADQTDGSHSNAHVGKLRTELNGIDIDPVVWQAHLSDLKAKRPFRDFVYSRTDDKGRRQYFRSSGKPVFGEGGTFTGYRGVASNITSEVEAEQDRLKAELRLARAVDTIPASFALYDSEDHLVISNQRYRERLREAGLPIDAGLKFSHLIGTFVRKEGISGSQSDISNWYQRRRDRRNVPVRAMEFERPNGRWESVSDYLLDDGSVITISLDVTERKAAESAMHESAEKLRQTREELFRVSRATAMGQISSAIAHEINQPLTAIRNYIQTGRRILRTDGLGQNGSEVVGFLDEAIEQTDRAADIIRGLREFIERRDSRRCEEDLNAIVKEATALALIGFDSSAVEVEWDLKEDLPSVLADKVQIAQVVINLVRNAIDAMAGEESRTITIATDMSDTGQARFSVVDRGAGLPKDVRRRLFQPFVTTKSDGMGIGLSISHTIITAHGGQLIGNDEPDKGAKFCFTLPLADELAKTA